MIEKVEDENGGACVVEIAVYEESALEILELGEAEVGRDGGVAALLAKQAHAHVRLLNHGDVVGAVSNSACHRLAAAVFHQFDDLKHKHTQID